MEEPEIFLYPNIKHKGKLHLISSNGITCCGIKEGRVNTHRFQRITFSYIKGNEMCKTCRNTALAIYKKWLMNLQVEEFKSVFFDTEDPTN